jgi:hypothetical protein
LKRRNVENKNSKRNYHNYCKDCKIDKVKETEHCEDCDVCIEDYDHHCVFFSKCIGGGNIWPFWGSMVMLIVNFVIIAVTVASDAIGNENFGMKAKHHIVPAQPAEPVHPLNP